MPLMAAAMLVPSMTLASSIRPGSRVTHDSLNSNSRKSISNCLVLVDDGEYVEEKWEKCEVVIDETGVTHPLGKITNVVQWTTEEKEFNVAGGIVGGAAGATVGFAAGLGSCAFRTILFDYSTSNNEWWSNGWWCCWWSGNRKVLYYRW